MADYFFDSSGLTKRYAREIGSAWVESITDLASGNTIFIAEITQVEVTAAIARKMRGGFLTLADGTLAFAKLLHDINDEYVLVEINSGVLQDADNLVKRHFLRGYDAVQLASALRTNQENVSFGLPPIIFVSADNDLNNAALAEGLAVENPNNYP
jgi:predicted nucleic acid-binding protein